jgi:hypothetical protein
VREKQRERIDWVCVSSLGMLGEKEWEEEWKDIEELGLNGITSKRVTEIMNGTQHVYLLNFKLFNNAIEKE